MEINKKIKYVPCKSCAWRITQEFYDPHKELCKACNNTREVVNPQDILCNMCGECMCPIGTSNEQIPHGLYQAKVKGGYASYHLFDMTNYIFSFCEQCLRKLFMQCKIPPEINDHVSERDFVGDQEAYEYRLWEDGGGHHQAYLDKKCNFVKDCPNRALYTQYVSGEFTEGCCCEEHKNLFQYSNSEMKKFVSNVLKPFL